MTQLDAFVLSQNLRQRLVEFSLDRNFVRNPKLTEICRLLWSGAAVGGGLISDLWVEGAFPSKTADETLADLVAREEFDGGLQDHLHARGAVPRDRKLYLHQREAIREAQKSYPDGARPALVITAGTGAGKTECFLLPILNDLFRRREADRSGVSCVILYPMNALVNDQVDRVHEWLKEQDEITLFHFTSDTPEDGHQADKDGMPRWKEDTFRMRTRQEARGLETHDGRLVDLGRASRGRTPDILITNYSMLEYMLCRPQDAVFFGDALRAIVLDEAHLYTGTLAAEITLLLRRLLQRCGLRAEDVLQIATSATLGTDEMGELERFAGKLFSKPQELVRVIRGQVQEVELPEIVPPLVSPTASIINERCWLTKATQSADGKTLLGDAEQSDSLCNDLSLLVGAEIINEAKSKAEDRPAALLYHTLGHAELLHRAKKIIDEKKRLPLRDYARQLLGDDSDESLRATVSLLQMGAAARPEAGAYPLLPHRLHVLARPTDGLVVCLNSDCSGASELKLDGLGCVIAGYSDHCLHCRCATLSLYRCANCGEVALAGIKEGRRLLPVPTGNYQNETRYFTHWQASKAEPIFLDAQTGEMRGAGYDGLKVFGLDACLNCDPRRHNGDEAWQPFVSSAGLTLSILAETALAELPELPEENNRWLPARGRRILAFSDSRPEAARLGPRLRLQHEIQLVRAALARCAAQSPASDKSTIRFWRQQIVSLEAQLSAPSLSPALRQTVTTQLEQARREFEGAAQGGSIQIWLELLKNEASLREILHAETSHKHRPDEWRYKPKQPWDENFAGVESDLRRLIGRELARAPLRREFSVETLGLLEVTYPGLDRIPMPPEIAGLLPALARDTLAAVWPDFLAALCDSLRTEGVVTLGGAKEDDDFQFSGVFIGRWCAEEKRRGRSLISFIGVREGQRRRQFAQAVLERCHLPAEQATQLTPDLLRAIFREMKARAGNDLLWLKKATEPTKDSPVEALQIHFPSLALRRPPKLYRCERSGHIWPRSVVGCAPESTAGELREATEDELDHDPRVGRQRRELRESQAFSMALWAEEHSAQLAPAENRRLQDLFKMGARNILSSTTTLELGIDIGGLNAALMSNVPPGKANYLQRAGRAGRRADGSSIVITYARPRPFDREVFARFGDYLDRSYRRPQIFLDRQRVVRRHGHAFLLGEFFRQIYPPGARVGAMNAFGNMGRFCGVEFVPYWDRSAPKPMLRPAQADWEMANRAEWFDPERGEAGLENHFLDFLQYLRQAGAADYQEALRAIYEGTPLIEELEDWPRFIDELERSFNEAVNDWRRDYESLLGAWSRIEENGAGNRQASPIAQANMLHYQSRALYETTVIEAFADRQFLPRYGFPIGMQKLRVIKPDEEKPHRIREEDQYRLERAGLLALREYVPGSQLLVGGRLVTSRGLLKHWTGAELDNYIGLRGSYAECQSGHTYYQIAGQLGDCPICGSEAAGNAKALLLPKHGFSSAAWDPPRLSADIERVGRVERATVTFAAGKADLSDDQFAGVEGLSARYREMGEILVYNAGDNNRGFAICLQCGYADSEENLVPGDLPNGFRQHARLTATSDRYPCWGSDHALPLRNQTLAARETTDVLLLTFAGPQSSDLSLMQTLGYALQIAGARLLELDTRELGVMVASSEEFSDGSGAVLYDNVPGGAGHVRELFARNREWLNEALSVLFVDERHDARCETACLDCLLTFDAQDAMNQGLLQRRRAYRLLKGLLAGGAPALQTAEQDGHELVTNEINSSELVTSRPLNKEERLLRGRSRLRKQGP
jgi:Lhr-like helicase